MPRKPYFYRVTFKNDYNGDIELSAMIARTTGPWDIGDDYEAIIETALDEIAANSLPTSDFTIARIACGGMIVAEF